MHGNKIDGAEVLALYQAGLTHAEIARRLGVDRRSVSGWLNRHGYYRNTGRVERLTNSDSKEQIEKCLRCPFRDCKATSTWCPLMGEEKSECEERNAESPDPVP